MEYSEKFLAFAEYLNLDEENYEDIEELSDELFEYQGDEYKILDKQELDREIEKFIDYESQETQNEINRVSLSDLNCEYYWNMYLSVDEDSIRENIEEDYPDFIGSGTVEEYGEYYIFLL